MPDPVLLELVVQRAGLDAEKSRGLGLDALGLLERFEDELALQVVEDLWQGHLLGHVEAIAIGRFTGNGSLVLKWEGKTAGGKKRKQLLLRPVFLFPH